MKTPRLGALKCAFLIASVLSILFVVPQALAQVPQLINYQGRVVAGTTNFNGTGQFKFALVNAAGTTTYWSNNNSSVNGSEPSAAVSLTVTNGLYSVLLGDPSIANMTSAIPVSVFNNADVRLRVWFNDSTHGSQLLSPDQRIAAVGYANMAANVPDGAITGAKIASGTITSANMANGAIGNAQIGNGAVNSSKIDTTTVQQRVTGTAPSGSFVTGINQNGTVTTGAPPAGLSSVSHDTTLSGNGTSGSPLGLAVPLSYTASFSSPLWYMSNSGTGPAIRGDGVGGQGVYGSSSNSYGVYGLNSSSSASYAGVYGTSTNSPGVSGSSTNSDGVVGTASSLAGVGVRGTNTGGDAVVGISTNHIGVYGSSSALNASGVTGSNNSGTGVEGDTIDGIGVEGLATSNAGKAVYGLGTNGAIAGFFDGQVEVFGVATGLIVSASSTSAPAKAIAANGGYYGVYSTTPSTGYGGYFDCSAVNNCYGVGVQGGGYGIYIANARDGVADDIGTHSGARLTYGGAWTNASSRTRKKNISALDEKTALETVRALEPITFEYKENDEAHVGFIAEDVPDLLATPDRTGLSSMDIVAVLTKVVQAQDAELAALRGEIAKLRDDSQKRLAAIEDKLAHAQPASNARAKASIVGDTLIAHHEIKP